MNPWTDDTPISFISIKNILSMYVGGVYGVGCVLYDLYVLYVICSYGKCLRVYYKYHSTISARSAKTLHPLCRMCLLVCFGFCANVFVCFVCVCACVCMFVGGFSAKLFFVRVCLLFFFKSVV